MLDELHIRDLGVIEDVTLRLAPGLNVLTGETGAGKTIVVSALELVCGARATTPMVRQGATTAVAEARLRPAPAAAADWVDAADDDLVVAREIAVSDAGGRSRARVGGHLAPVSALRSLVGEMIDMHGQQDSTRLTVPAAQRDLLDRYGGAALAAALDVYRSAWTAHTAARQELDRLQSSRRERVREHDRLRYELDEIEAVAPAHDEELQLDADLRRMEHAEGLMLAGREAAALLTGDGGARDALGAGVAVLRRMSGVDTVLDRLHERLERLAVEAQDVGLELAGYADGVSVDPAALEQLRARRSAIAQLVRKYGVDTGEVVAYAERARERIEQLETDDEQERELAAHLAILAGEVDATSGALHDLRVAAAERLERAVEGHLRDLAMTGARLAIRLTATPPGPDGGDRVDFLLAADVGGPTLELGRFASGGERSRIALALRLALADADDTPVLVFDEVDAGIGGAVARHVGAKLAALARGRQVLCVTHSPQLAAHADAHFVVTKEFRNGRAHSQVRRLDRDERVRELSRMLSGSTDSAVATRHADELLTTIHAG